MKVKLWPAPTGINATVCAHRYGAVATFSEQTDSRFEKSAICGEMIGFETGFCMGDFISQYGLQYNIGIYDMENTGVIRHDVYFFTDMWKNPTTGVLEVIPDYYAAAWTALGAAAFGVSIGTTKTVRTPNHGQQLFNLTSGVLGYDFVNSISGANGGLELKGIVDSQKDWFKQQVNREASSFSFRNGEAAGAGMLYPYDIGNRNSSNGPISTNASAQTFYGGSYGFKTGALDIREYFNNYVNTTRWWDFWSNMGYTRAQADAYAVQEFLKTLLNNGWFHDFIHWHSAVDAGTIDTLRQFLNLIRSNFGVSFVWTCSNGEALEYMFLRESCQRVAAVPKGNSVIVLADIIPPFASKTVKGVPAPDKFTQYNIPLSVRVDLTGTYLAGKSVKSSYGKLRSLGSNVYICELPLVTKEDTILAVELYEGVNGIFSEARPTGTTSIAGTELTVTTDLPTKAVLYEVAAGGDRYDSKAIARVQTYATAHVFKISSGKSYRVGIITDFKQSNLLTV